MRSFPMTVNTTKMLNLKPSKASFLKAIATLILFIVPLQIRATEVQIDYPDYRNAFADIDRQCGKQKPPVVNSSDPVIEKQMAALEIECYANAMVERMRAAPEYRELILQSALKRKSSAMSRLVETALKAGMAPLVVLVRTLEIYPQKREEIGRAAMRAGVDPIVVTEATSPLQN